MILLSTETAERETSALARLRGISPTVITVAASIRRLGNSDGVFNPRSILDEAGIAVDSPAELIVDGSSLVLRKIALHPREGWADDAPFLADGPEDNRFA